MIEIQKTNQPPSYEKTPTKTKTCETHGEFIVKGIFFDGDWKYFGACPKCVREFDKKKELSKKIGAIVLRRKNLNIPENLKVPFSKLLQLPNFKKAEKFIKNWQKHPKHIIALGDNSQKSQLLTAMLSKLTASQTTAYVEAANPSTAFKKEVDILMIDNIENATNKKQIQTMIANQLLKGKFVWITQKILKNNNCLVLLEKTPIHYENTVKWRFE